MIIKSTKSGFSLAEVLITVGLIGVLAAILVPSLNQFKPNKNKAMFKKAYQEISRISYELVNDTAFYPDGDGVDGFDNVSEVQYNGATYGDNDSQVSNNAKCKFTNLFATKLNTIGNNISCTDAHTNFSNFVNGNLIGTPSFTTTDGIVWVLPKTNFSVANVSTHDIIRPILIDVNGAKSPNSMDNSSGICRDSVDRFLVIVHSNGKIEPSGVCAREYVKDFALINNASSFDYGLRPSDVFQNDGNGHVSASQGDANGDEYFDGDTGNCNPSLFESDPKNSGCF